MTQSECATINQSLFTQEKNVSLAPPEVLVLMPHYRVDCEGNISNWLVVFNGKHNESFQITFTVWQPDLENKQYTLVGKNQLILNYLENVNLYNLTVNEEDQIFVNPGNVIGFYTNSSESLNESECGVRVSLADPQVVTYYYPYSGLEENSSLNIDDQRKIQVYVLPLVAPFVGKQLKIL